MCTSVVGKYWNPKEDKWILCVWLKTQITLKIIHWSSLTILKGFSKDSMMRLAFMWGAGRDSVSFFVSSSLKRKHSPHISLQGYVQSNELKLSEREDDLYLKQRDFSWCHETTCSLIIIIIHLVLIFWEEHSLFNRQFWKEIWMFRPNGLKYESNLENAQHARALNSPLGENWGRSLSETLEVSWGPNNVTSGWRFRQDHK